MTGKTGFLIALLFLSGIVSVQGQENFDTRLFRSINGQQNPEQNGFFEYLDYSTLPTFAAVPVGFFVAGAVLDDKATADVALMSFVGQLTALGVTVALKEVVDRPRPFLALSDVRVKHQWSANGASFPSGHTAQAFAIATVLALNYGKPGITIPCFLWAAAVGYGRVYLGVHYPSDVAAGAVVGILSGFVGWSLRSQIESITRSAFGEKRSLQIEFPRADLIRIRIPF